MIIKIKKIIIISIFAGLILPIFSFAEPVPITPPENLDQAKEMGKKALETTQKELPGIIGKIWREEVLPIWQKMYSWFKTNIWPKIWAWFKKEIEPKAKQEIEKRKPIVQEEFKKEKEEVKTEIKQGVIQKAVLDVWEKLKQFWQ